MFRVIKETRDQSEGYNEILERILVDSCDTIEEALEVIIKERDIYFTKYISENYPNYDELEGEDKEYADEDILYKKKELEISMEKNESWDIDELKKEMGQDWYIFRNTDEYVYAKHFQNSFEAIEYLVEEIEDNNIIDVEGIVLKYSYKLEYLIGCIKKSLYIFDLDNEQGDYSYKTWERAINFLINYALWAKNNFGKRIAIPRIFKGSNGVICLLWEYGDTKLLIDINKDGICSFGYSKGDNNKSKGSFLLEEVAYGMFPNMISNIDISIRNY